MDNVWSDLCEMAGLEQFKDIPRSVATHLTLWQAIFDSSDPHRAIFPPPFENVTPLERLCLLRCLRRDKMELAIQDFITRVRHMITFPLYLLNR